MPAGLSDALGELANGTAFFRCLPARSLFESAVNPTTAPLLLVELLLQFTHQLEEIGALVIVIIVGALLTPATLGGKNVADSDAIHEFLHKRRQLSIVKRL